MSSQQGLSHTPALSPPSLETLLPADPDSELGAKHVLCTSSLQLRGRGREAQPLQIRILGVRVLKATKYSNRFSVLAPLLGREPTGLGDVFAPQSIPSSNLLEGPES